MSGRRINFVLAAVIVTLLAALTVLGVYLLRDSRLRSCDDHSQFYTQGTALDCKAVSPERTP